VVEQEQNRIVLAFQEQAEQVLVMVAEPMLHQTKLQDNLLFLLVQVVAGAIVVAVVSLV
jgi:hypothetical protein